MLYPLSFLLHNFNLKISEKINDKIFDFLVKNPNPNDSQVHAFAEKENIDVQKIEKEIYKLATNFVTLMSGGLAKEKGITEKEVDPKQLKKGIKVELEHTKDYNLAKKIALDHLAEIPNYYDILEKMEKAEH